MKVLKDGIVKKMILFFMEFISTTLKTNLLRRMLKLFSIYEKIKNGKRKFSYLSIKNKSLALLTARRFGSTRVETLRSSGAPLTTGRCCL